MTKTCASQERGETSVQAVVLVPVVFLLAFMCFHIGSLMHQSHIAQVAAIRGAAVASSMNPGEDARRRAHNEIERVVSDLNSRLVRPPVISYRDSGVQVKVSLRASSAISFLASEADAMVWQPLETFQLEQYRR